MTQTLAGIRATFGLATPDALVVATGIVCQVSHPVTNDERWKKRLKQIAGRIRVLYLDDLR